MTDTVTERVALGEIPGVELIHVGTWQISTGEWTVTPLDLQAAVDALQCPAVREPVLKLGHTDPRFDGEPATGWITGMRVTDDGNTLVGDFVGMPKWLVDVAASAYPDRSVEGQYGYECQLGHTHPFVLTGVALLGVTPPGVGTLGSLQDIAALYGVAAAGAPRPGRPVTVVVHASPQVPPTAPVAGVEKGAGMDPAKIREALGLAPDSSDVELAAALAAAAATLTAPAADAPAAEAAPETTPAPAPAPAAPAAPVAASALPEGVVTVDQETLKGLQVAAAAGLRADERLREQDRDNAIMAAIQAGKIAPARRAHFEASWAADPEGTKTVLASLAPGLVPVAASGYAGETETGSGDDAYAALYGTPEEG